MGNGLSQTEQGELERRIADLNGAISDLVNEREHLRQMLGTPVKQPSTDSEIQPGNWRSHP